MVDIPDPVSPDETLVADESSAARQVLHWYDFLCPFCYVGQQRNSIFEDHGSMVRRGTLDPRALSARAVRAIGASLGLLKSGDFSSGRLRT
jgi:hypothetical protein